MMRQHHLRYVGLKRPVLAVVLLAGSSACSLFAPTDSELFGRRGEGGVSGDNSGGRSNGGTSSGGRSNGGANDGGVSASGGSPTAGVSAAGDSTGGVGGTSRGSTT